MDKLVEGEAPAIYEDNTYDSEACEESVAEGYIEDECLGEYCVSTNYLLYIDYIISLYSKLLRMLNSPVNQLST